MSIEKKNNNNSCGISRRDVLKLGAAGMVSVTTGFGLDSAKAFASRKAATLSKQSRPNILLIITDQHHLDATGAAGCKYIDTPALDSLWRSGVAFRNCYSTNPVCSPARSSIFTGRMPSETGVFENGLPIHESIPNIGQWLNEHTNYETVYAGKWHLPWSWMSKQPGFKTLTTGVAGQGNLGDTCVSLACEGFLRNYRSNKPFFLVASLLQPHDICEWLRLNVRNNDQLRYPEIANQLPPLPENFEVISNEPALIKTRRQRASEPARGKWSKLHWRYYIWSYYRMVEQVDREIGRIIKALNESGKVDNTLVIFVSDHGEGLARHQLVRKNSLYDEATNVPMVVSFPGRINANVVDKAHLVSQLDIVPTICDYAGINLPPNQRGRSLRPLLEGHNAQWRSLVASELGAKGCFARMIRTDRYKYVKYADDPIEQLFDMIADPGEMKNLAAEAKSASELKAHRKLLAEWEAQLTPSPSLPESQFWPRS